MKTIKLFAFLMISGLLISSCSSDSQEVQCTPIECLNNGVSNDNCGCDCPQGFTGENCGTVITPSKVIITKIVVKAFDNNNSNGFRFDTASGADIYVKVNSGNTVIYTHSNYYPNATSGLSTNYNFVLNPSLQITNVNAPLVVSLWDYDLEDIPSDADDYMASSAFFPFNGINFPDSIIITDPSTGTKFEVFLSYQW